MNNFRILCNEIKNDLPTSKFTLVIFLHNFLFNPEFRIFLNYRIGKFFYFNKLLILRQIGHYYRYKLISKRGCDISYHATLGENLTLAHPIAIVIGKGTLIGHNVTIFQNVTLGSHGKSLNTKEYPIIGDNVTIYAGAKVIGGIQIGKHAIVGANAVVTRDVPDYAVVVGIPAKVINKAK